jgi:hypothetical protein
VKKRVYIETTIVSYLTARPSRSAILLGQQRLTREWWREHRQRYELYVSQAVLDEAGDGDPREAQKRLAVMSDLPLLDAGEGTMRLAAEMVRRGFLPHRATTDAAHLAIAAASGMDVLLTWNCTHLANIDILLNVNRFLRQRGYEPPLVCTPAELTGGAEAIEE